MNRLRRWRRLHSHGFGSEVEGNAEDIGVFSVKETLLVQLIGVAAQGAADHLLAQQLCPKGAHAEYMCDGVGVPAFGQHRDGDDAADRAAQAVFFADGVHHLAQQVLVADVVSQTAVAGAFDNLAAVLLDFVGRHLAEVGVQRLPRLQLLAVNQHRIRLREPVTILVVVAKQRQPSL